MMLRGWPSLLLFARKLMASVKKRFSPMERKSGSPCPALLPISLLSFTTGHDKSSQLGQRSRRAAVL